MNIQINDTVRHRGSRTRYRVVQVRPDGLVVGKNITTGQKKTLTRPEMLRKVEKEETK
jgi:hypothetical protein